LAQLPAPITYDLFTGLNQHNLRDTHAPWLIQTGIFGFVRDACAAGMDHDQLASVIPEAPLPSFSYIHTAVSAWLEERSQALYSMSLHLRCRVMSINKLVIFFID
jgi:hypothetical protein